MSPTAAADTARARILDTALQLMSAQGASATSMRQLATACHLNVATLYHYFPSKADLLRSVIEERRYGERLSTDCPPIDASLPPAERLAALVGWLWQMALEEQDVWRLIVGESIRGESAANATTSALVALLDGSLHAWLADLFPELGDHAGAVARIVRGQLFSYVVEELAIGFTPSEAEARAAELGAIVFP